MAIFVQSQPEAEAGKMPQPMSSPVSATNFGRKFYKPLILRVPGLLFMFTIAIALIGVLEYAARTLPLVENKINLQNISHGVETSVGKGLSPQISERSLIARAKSQSTSIVIASPISTSLYESTTQPEPATSTANPDAYIAISSLALSTTIEIKTTQTAYIPIDSTFAASSDPNAYIPIATTLTPSATAPNAYIPIASASSSATSSDYIPIVSTLTPSATAPNAYIPIDTTLEFSTAQGGYIATLTTSNTAYLATVTEVRVSTTRTTDTSGNVQTLLSTYTTSFQSVSTSNLPEGENLKFDPVLITWPLWWVFVAGYLPLLLAILVKIFWTSVYFNVKLVEPFIQLSKSDGALGSDVFCTHYLSSDLTPDYISSIYNRRWLIFWTSFVYLLVGILAPLASEVLFLDIHYECGSDICWPPKLSADRTVLRLLQGLLSFIAIMTLNIMIMLYRSTTGLYSNPSSIASIASLAHNPEVLDDFKNMSDEISSKDLKAQLGQKRYQMGMYERQDGLWRYGIVPATQSYSSGWTQVSLDPAEKSTKPEKKKSHHISTSLDIAFGIFILGLLGVVVAYFMDGSNSGFNRFFNSNTFGPRFFMSSLGSLIAMYWKGIERKVQTLTPFRKLIASPAPAKPSILFKRHSLLPLVLYTSLVNGHFFAVLIAFTTFLADILTITLAVIPYSPNEIYLELLICAYTSMAILSLMVLVILGLLFWKRKLRDMPRKPDTLAGVMSYFCDSHLLMDFEGCDTIKGAELDKRIGRSGKRYEFGQFVGVSGKQRWMIEEEGIVL